MTKISAFKARLLCQLLFIGNIFCFNIYIYAYQKVILHLNSDGFLTKKSTSVYGVCVAGRRQQASKSYENFTDIIMHNTLLISQQHQQILPLGSSWIVLEPPSGLFTASWERLEEWGPWWAQDEPRNAAVQVSTAPWTTLVSSGARNVTNRYSWKQTMLIWVRALSMHFSKVMWFRICLMEISGRILAIQGHGVIPFFEPILPLLPLKLLLVVNLLLATNHTSTELGLCLQ